MDEETMDDESASRIARQITEKWAAAIEQIQQVFALPGVQQAVWDVEAAELCEQVDAWLAAVEEERCNGN